MKLRLFLLSFVMCGIAMAQVKNPAPDAGAQQTASRTDLSGGAISACGSITHPGDYYLSQNLTCPGTALLISGPGIDLNLNGHTITYGTAGGAIGAVYGIENNACWDASHKARAVPCDNANAGIGATIYNGTIVQSTHAPAFSHAFFIGQNNNDWRTVDIHNVTITIQQTGTSAFYSNFESGQIVFEHNTIYDNVKTINYPGQSIIAARDEFQGQAVMVANSSTMQQPDLIDNNKIVGSPQGGILDSSTGTRVFQNDISMNSTFTNDFCVDAPGINQQIYSNYCHPINGRGIHVNGQGTRVSNNLVVVTEAPVNAEYHGCELDGAYGIQMEDDIRLAGGISVAGNTVTLNTGACGGAALRITGWNSGSPAIVGGNTWIVNRTPGADQFSGLLYSFDDDNLADVKFTGDDMQTNDQYCAQIAWDGAQNVVLPLGRCKAPYVMSTANGTDSPSTFNVPAAPAVTLACGAQSVSHGTINGIAVKCPK